MVRVRHLLVSLLVLAGCRSSSPALLARDASANKPIDAASMELGNFQSCTGRAYQATAAEDWRHRLATPLVTMLGGANHSAQDGIAAPGMALTLNGKFSYGIISKDLEDEDVAAFYDDCTGWRSLGRATTSSDGRISVAAPDGPPGVYEVRLQVLGDQSVTTGYVWRLPAGSRLTLTDIDGTMTESDSQLFMQIFDGSHTPVAYPGAADLTRAHAKQGWPIVYLTGRPYWLTGKTRTWLTDLGFQPGPVHVTDSNEEAIPSESGVGNFKKAWISKLLAAGYKVDFAYGNATTDVYAYLGAGLRAEDSWIIGPHGGAMGTHSVMGSWVSRAGEVGLLPLVTQPFRWTP